MNLFEYIKSRIAAPLFIVFSLGYGCLLVAFIVLKSLLPGYRSRP